MDEDVRNQLIAIVVIGVVAGSMATRVVRGRGFGLLGNIVVGTGGGFAGAYSLQYTGYSDQLIDSTSEYGAFLISAIIGSVVLLILAKLISRDS